MMRRNRKIDLKSSTEIKSGDRFILKTTLKELEELSDAKDIVIANFIGNISKNTKTQGSLLEVVVSTKSKIQGSKFSDTNLRKFYKLSIIGISQSDESKIKRIKDLIIQPGDMILLQCKNQEMKEKLPSIGLIPVSESTVQLRPGLKKYIPAITFLIAILLVAFSFVPADLGFAAAALLLLIIDDGALKYVYKRFDWSIIILLAAMIPIGDALTQTGGAALIAYFILHLFAHLSVFIMIGIIIVITMFLSDVINNAATAIVMAPIAISLANALNISIDAFLMAVAVGASCAFLTPIGHQNNLLVMGPGRYKFFDYARIGLPLEIIILAVATPLIYFFWYLK